MVIVPDDNRKFHQGAVTKSNLHLELTFSFSLRPAGWAGNDSNRLLLPLLSVIRVVTALLQSTGVLCGDESFGYAARWRRPDEDDWTAVKIVDE